MLRQVIAVALAMVLGAQANNETALNTTKPVPTTTFLETSTETPTTVTTLPPCQTKPQFRTSSDGGLELSVGCNLDITLSENEGNSLSLREQVNTNNMTAIKLKEIAANLATLTSVTGTEIAGLKSASVAINKVVSTLSTDLNTRVVATESDLRSLNSAVPAAVQKITQLNGVVAGNKKTAAADVAGLRKSLEAKIAAHTGKKCPAPTVKAGLTITYQAGVDRNQLWPGAHVKYNCQSVCYNNGRTWAKYYHNIGGGSTGNLYHNGNFKANRYSHIDSTTSTTSKFQSRISYGNNFGGVVKGYFKAPVTGNYKFYTRSDDSSLLEISTKPFPEHSMERVVTLNGCCREQGGLTLRLTKGKHYLMRALYKEGGGGDYVYVGIDWPGHTRETRGKNAVSSKYFECPQREGSSVAAAFCRSDGTWSANPPACGAPYATTGTTPQMKYP